MVLDKDAVLVCVGVAPACADVALAESPCGAAPFLSPAPAGGTPVAPAFVAARTALVTVLDRDAPRACVEAAPA